MSKFNCKQPKLFLHELWQEAFTIFSGNTNLHRYFFCSAPNEPGSIVGIPLKPAKLPAPNGIASIWNVPRYNVALLSPAFTGSDDSDGGVGPTRDKFGCWSWSACDVAKGSWKSFWALTISSKKKNWKNEPMYSSARNSPLKIVVRNSKNIPNITAQTERCILLSSKFRGAVMPLLNQFWIEWSTIYMQHNSFQLRVAIQRRMYRCVNRYWFVCHRNSANDNVKKLTYFFG